MGDQHPPGSPTNMACSQNKVNRLAMVLPIHTRPEVILLDAVPDCEDSRANQNAATETNTGRSAGMDSTASERPM